MPDAAAGQEPGSEPEPIADDRLRLVFTCCHPALAEQAQVALTLRLVCGLSTAEIAQAFLVSEATMAARVTRAKKKISAARIPYRVPGPAELPDRLDAVLTVVHRAARHPDDARRLGKLFASLSMEQRRIELAISQVARAAEHHEIERINFDIACGHWRL